MECEAVEIEAHPTLDPAKPEAVALLDEKALRRELADCISNRNQADGRARAAKEVAGNAEALMCAAGEKVAYGGHRSRLSRACPLRPKSRRKGEACLGPIAEMAALSIEPLAQVCLLHPGVETL